MATVADKIKSLRLKKARLDREAMAKRAIPLVAFYGRGELFEARRNKFYDDCAKNFKWAANPLTDPMDAIPVVPATPQPQTALASHRASTQTIRNSVVHIDHHAAPFEFMVSSGLLKTSIDRPGLDTSRFEAGMKLRTLLHGAEVKSLKSVDLDAIGGRSVSGYTPTEYAFDCLRQLQRVRSLLEDGKLRTIWRESGPYVALERLIYRDDWSIINLPKQKRQTVVLQIHHSLDVLASSWGYMTPEEFRRRWA